MAKGKKTGGRQAGTPNKLTAERIAIKNEVRRVLATDMIRRIPNLSDELAVKLYIAQLENDDIEISEQSNSNEEPFVIIPEELQ